MANYLDDLNTKLKVAQNRLSKGRQMKTLKETAPDLLEIIDTEVSLSINRMNQSTPLTYEEYLSEHGVGKGLRRIRDLINAAEADAVVAAREANVISEQVKQIENDRNK